MIRVYGKIFCFLIFLLVSWSIKAQKQIGVSSLAFVTTESQNKLIFDVTGSTKYRVFVMENPARLVIDIINAELSRPLVNPPAKQSLFGRVTTLNTNETDLRVLVDLKIPVNAKKFSLISNITPDHLVIELNSKASSTVSQHDSVVASADTKSKNIKTKEIASKPIIIAIDSGHGGNDPGAKGVQGTEEKLVTFQISKKLEALINSQQGMRAVMVRTGDYYVGLRERMNIARAAKADVFVSIHADAFQDTLIKGASVYTLSTNGASSEAARWLADSENASDMVGVNLQDKEDDLASTLFDLTQKDTREESVNVANHILKSFANVSPLHKDTVQKAGFMVLKSPDIPSILVETAFISNPSEEQNLLSQAFQTKMAKAIFNGLYVYFQETRH
ncbi:MAG: N-acetylmuramoyl-L-alanine amidase [Methylococcales bacterium]|nr:N-acetylmuramoyl-L-alanine amidase [Methylococcales bacterium]